MIFLIYHLAFLIAPAYFHVKENRFPFYGMSYEDDVILVGAGVCLVFIISVLFGYYLNFSKNKFFIDKKLIPSAARYSNFRVGFMIYSGILIQIFSIQVYGVYAFLVRRDLGDVELFGSSTQEQALILTGVRGISYICILLFIFLYKNNIFLRVILAAAVSLLFLILNFPTAISRTQLFSYILAFVMMKYSVTKKLKLNIFLAVVVGLGTLLPLSSHIGRGEGEYSLDLIEYYTSSGDFDGFQSLLNVVKTVNSNSITYGGQLFGGLFAFVPRDYWPGKPQPTGVASAEFVGYGFTNTSAPIVSELYMDFWWIGVIIGGFLIGMVLSKLDILNFNSENKNFISTRLYLAVLFSFSLILFRGSLMSVISPLYVELAVLFLVFFVSKIRSIRTR